MAVDAQILTRAASIENCIAGNEINNAVKLLLDFVRDYALRSTYYKEAILLSADFHKLESDARMGIVTYEQSKVARKQMLYQILTLPDLIISEMQLPNAA